MEPTVNPQPDHPAINENGDAAQTPITHVIREISSKLLSEYQAQLAKLLSRIENSTTHYEALGLELSASYDQIVRAFYGIVNMVYPAHQIRNALSQQQLERMDAAFNKSSEAFTTLANFQKRADYHSTVLSRVTGSRPPLAPVTENLPPPDPPSSVTVPALNEVRQVATETLPTPRLASQTLATELPAPHNRTEGKRPITGTGMPIYPATGATPGEKTCKSEFAVDNQEGNRRRNQRCKLCLPVRITGYDKKSARWQENTHSIDVSRTGVTVRLQKNVRYGNIFYITLPLPEKFREQASAELNYSVYAIVRRIEPQRDGLRVVALEFIGDQPPKEFLEKPWAVFHRRNWTGGERRRSPRARRQERVRLEYFDSCARLISREEAVTENVSPTGMQIFVKFAPSDFDLVRVSCVTRKFDSLAIVRNRFVPKDGVERLCVQFLKRDGS